MQRYNYYHQRETTELSMQRQEYCNQTEYTPTKLRQEYIRDTERYKYCNQTELSTEYAEIQEYN